MRRSRVGVVVVIITDVKPSVAERALDSDSDFLRAYSTTSVGEKLISCLINFHLFFFFSLVFFCFLLTKNRHLVDEDIFIMCSTTLMT